MSVVDGKRKSNGQYTPQWIPSRCHPEKKHYGLGLCHKCYCASRNAKNLENYYKNREKILERQRGQKRKKKFIVLEYYGGLPPECRCCGERNIEFLTIDHINGGGNAHRKTMRGENFYSYLIKNDFPDGYRVLCMNCNWGRGKFGYCPHENFEE